MKTWKLQVRRKWNLHGICITLAPSFPKKWGCKWKDSRGHKQISTKKCREQFRKCYRDPNFFTVLENHVTSVLNKESRGGSCLTLTKELVSGILTDKCRKMTSWVTNRRPQPAPCPLINILIFFHPGHSYSNPLPIHYRGKFTILKQHTYADFFAIFQKERLVCSVFCKV